MHKRGDTSHSVMSMKPDTKSILRSQVDIFDDYKKHDISKITQQQLNPKPIIKQQILKPRNQLKSIQKSKQSIPYRLYITKIYDIPSIAKKSNASTLFIHFSINVYTKKQREGLGDEIQPLGETYHYQCQQALFRKEQGRHQFPSSFFYHSKVDKNSHSVFFAISVKIVEMKSGIVQNSHNLGFFILEDPFVQTNSNQTVFLCRQTLSQFQYTQFDNYRAMSKGVQNTRLDYQIRSLFELKKLTKLIPQNTIVTQSQKIVGLNDIFLPNDYQIDQIVQSASIRLKLKYLQVHIPDKFQQTVLSTVRKFPNQLFGQKEQIKNRKILISFFNYKTILNTVQKKLQYVQKQSAGDWTLTVYQGLKDGQTLNFPYYLEDTNYPISVLLLYQIGNKEIEVAQYIFNPLTNGQSHQISEQMVTQNMMYPLKANYLIKTNCNRKPTIITEYVSEDILDNQSLISGIPMNEIGHKSSQQFMRSSQKLIQDKTQQLKEKDRLIQEIQFERMSLQKQRGQIEKIKTENYISYQEEFQRRFQLEKESLMKRQQLLETQYKEQVQRQIRQKSQLQDQIKEMKEKVKKIQLEKEQKNMDQQGSYDLRINDLNQNHHLPGSPNLTNYKTGFANSFQATGRHQVTTPQNMQIRQKIDPVYLMEPQMTIPVTKVRQMMKKTQVSKQLIEISKGQFNRASKFTLTFSAIAWYEQVNRPKQLFFLIRFFNFPEYRTDKLTYLQNQNPQGYCQLLRSYQYNLNVQEVSPIYTFTVDPSEYRNPKMVQQDLTNYLSQNSCIVDIFDGNTHIYLGQINIRLSELIRGNKTQTFIAKQYSLMKIKTKLQIGSIQILIKNEQQMCKQSFQFKANSNVKDEKKKVISYTPMTIPNDQNKITNSSKKIGSVGQEKQSKNRMQQRIQKFKQRQRQRKIQQNSQSFIVLPNQDKKNILARIANHKQKNKTQYIKTVYSSLLHEKISINAEFGKAQTFPYTFVNQSTTPSSYKIVVDSEQSYQNETQILGRKNISDLQVIKNSAQWRYYVKHKGYLQPKFYQIINENNVFYLNPGESLTIVFKYLTFAHFTKTHEDIHINVSIVKIDSNWIAGGFNLQVQPHQQIVHHSYILYQPGNQLVDLILPVIYTKIEEYGPGSLKKLYLTDEDQNTQAQWLNDYQILLKIQTPEIMTKKTFNLLLYDDQFFDQLKQNWLIVINSYEGVWTQCRPDANTKFKLALPMNNVPLNLGLNFYSSSLNNSLVLNSSDPSIQFQNDRILIEFSKMRQGGAFQIWCQLFSSYNFKRQIQITCTSQQNSTLVYGWIVQIFPYSIKKN